MNHINLKSNIFGRRILAAFVAIVSAFAYSVAGTPWNGTDKASAFQSGSGSPDDPYIISTPAQLKYLQSELAKNNSALRTKSFKLGDDIDLNHHFLGMIGNGTVASATAETNAFMGTFDGDGHVIYNLYVKVDNQANANMAFGLFGYLKGATVRNLIIANATITRETEAETTNFVDIRMGVLAGMVAPTQNKGITTRIENIIIYDSEINDGGHVGNSRSYFIGGAIGDITSGAGGSSTMGTGYDPIVIRNIYADVDIDYSTAQRSHLETATPYQNSQFNIGGILGRLRRGLYSHLPDNTFYTGTIKAPIATISPTWGMVRTSSDNTTEAMMTRSYAGQIFVNGSNNESTNYVLGLTNSSVPSPEEVNQHRYFSAYKVYNPLKGVVEEITATYPSGDGCDYGTRTFNPNHPATGATYTHTSPTSMSKYQGYNHGTHITNSQRVDVFAAFNDYAATDDNLLPWFDMGSGQMPRLGSQNLVTLTRLDYFNFTASPLVPSTAYYLWEGRVKDSEDWVQLRLSPTALTSDSYQFSGTGSDTPLNYSAIRVTLTDAFGSPLEPQQQGFYLIAAPHITIERQGFHDFTASMKTDYPADYKIRWTGRLLGHTYADDAWDAIPVNAVTTQNPQLTTHSATADYEGNYYVQATLYLPDPGLYSEIRAELLNVNGQSLDEEQFKEIHYTVAVSRTSYDGFHVDGTWGKNKNKTDGLTSGYFYRVVGNRLDPATNTYVDDVLIANIPMTDNWAIDFNITPFTDHYTTITVEMVASNDTPGDTSDDLILKSASYTVEHPSFSASTERSLLYYAVFKGYLTGNKYKKPFNINWYGVRRDDSSIEPINGSHVVVELVETFTASSTTNIDAYSEVIAVLCDDNRDEFYPQITYVIPIADIGMSVTRTSGIRFSAAVTTDYPIDKYHYRWEGKRKDTGLYEQVGYTSVNYADIHNIDDYSSLRCTLVAPDNSDLLNDEMEVEPLSTFYYVRIAKVEKDPGVADSPFIYLASIYNPEGDVVYGGGSVTFDSEGNPTVTGAIPLDSGYFWMWDVSSDPTSRVSWEKTDISDVSRPDVGDIDLTVMGVCNWIKPMRSDRYYRVAWAEINYDPSHNLIYIDDRLSFKRLSEDVKGPYNVIFVYDKVKTEHGRNIIVGKNGNNYPLTPFDGIDRSVYEDDGVTLRIADDGNPFDPEYPDGDDTRRGYAPYAPVKTLRRAYEVAEADRPAEENIIVIMGYYYDGSASIDPMDVPIFVSEKYFSKPVTITGERGNLITGGAISMCANGTNTRTLFGRTIFRDIVMTGYKFATGSNLNPMDFYLVCNLHDLTIADGVRVAGFVDRTDTETASIGLITGIPAPHFTIVGCQQNRNASTELPERPGNVDPNFTTININSGCFARLICSGRNTSVNSASKNIIGSLNKPFRVKANISITHTDDPYEYCLDHDYDFDIGLLVGGQTDGSVYAEAELYMNDGRIGRFISGNISYGRAVEVGGKSYPADTFFGSTKVNLQGGSIHELFGGSLGRFGASSGYTEKSDAYFYGRSEIIIDGATVDANIYGSGAGGVSGVGRCEHDGHHTLDVHIPYLKVYNDYSTLDYASFDYISQWMHDNYPDDAISASHDGTHVVADLIPTFPMADGNRIPLGISQSYVNIYSGTIHGDVFGGGRGVASGIHYDRALTQAGDLFGSTQVTIGGMNRAVAPKIYGSVYGGGEGSDQYYRDQYAANIATGMSPEDAKADALEKFQRLARVFGNTSVRLLEGTIYGNVYGGSKGVPSLSAMSTIYGNASVVLDGATVMGDIFGGCQVADINRNDSDLIELNSGNASVTILSGVVGNNVFGASEGMEGHQTWIEGNTSVTIKGGSFYPSPYLDDTLTGDALHADSNKRNFNIYGGGYYTCRVDGDTKVDITSSLLTDEGSLDGDFNDVWSQLEYRRFCVYGGGYGANTVTLGNASVTIDIPVDKAGATMPNAFTEPNLVPGQMFFDVAGGGYSGSIGKWKHKYRDNGLDPSDANYIKDYEVVETYAEYDGGDVTVDIHGYPFIRKVIGGGFYGNVNNADTHVRSGTVGTLVGGALLGYVHNSASLTVGSRIADFPAEHADSAAFYNSYLFITKDIYGGNDVKGIVGTTKWTDLDGNYVSEAADGEPLFAADVSDADGVGVHLNLFGGTILGDVFGAGNGHYRGYYVPGWARYGDGPDRHYTNVRSHWMPGGRGRVYRSRPMTGSVKINIAGNTTTDRVNIKGNFFGGGRSCTIGQYNTQMPVEDPRRISKGGFLHVNFGSHVLVEGNVYMGDQGEHFNHQPVLKSDDEGNPLDVYGNPIDMSTFRGLTNAELNRIGDLAYTHWYWDEARNSYRPGFPRPGTVDGNYGIPGEHMLRGFLKNIEMKADVELTFYDNLYDGEGHRKRWVPGEMAMNDYDATDVQFNSLYLGGLSGSMTNNVAMKYDYRTNQAIDPSKEDEFDLNHPDTEEFGSIYRVSVSSGITILDKLVMGSENAMTKVYDYNDKFTALVTTDASNKPIAPTYTFNGGLVTQSSFTYELIVYYDRLMATDPDVFIDPWLDYNVYKMSPTDPAYDSYVMRDGTRIFRYNYDENNPFIPNSEALVNPRYSLAVTYDNEAARTGIHGFVGPRGNRVGNVVVKLTAGCKFVPQKVEDDPLQSEGAEARPTVDLRNYFGGNIYGGCYNSGITDGDVVLNLGTNGLGDYLTDNNPNLFGEISGLSYNLGRVFGGGFGAETEIVGNVYINLVRNFKAMNVFGGGMQGNISGSTTINYIGDEMTSFVYGAIYGGGLQGSVGVPEETVLATNVNLWSGNVDLVYAGSCMGDLYGRANLRLLDEHIKDEDTDPVDHLDIKRLLAYTQMQGWGGSRLFVGTAYGGNDISGNIILPSFVVNGTHPSDKPAWTDIDRYSTYIKTEDMQDPELANETTPSARPMGLIGNGDENSENPEGSEEPTVGPGKTSPGSFKGYNGFPLVGSLFAGSNGNYGKDINGYYASGEIEIATGERTGTTKVYLYADPESGREAMPVPHIDRARLDIDGGTMVNVYGGGNRSSVTGSTEINVDYNSDNLYAYAGFSSQNELDRIWNVMHLESNQQIDEATTLGPSGERVFNNQIFRLFGGNNYAPMAIQPTWNLVRAHVGSIYSGGNFGAMTYFNDDPTLGDDEPHGLSLTINSRDLHAVWVYGGGRVGEIAPAAPASFTKPYYGATVNILDGVIDHVFGGNDVAGTVLHGTRVNIQGAISGDVYCAGNGNYRYFYDVTLEPGNPVEECYSDAFGGRYFRLPRIDAFGDETTDAAHRLMAINHYRPNVERAYLTISGTADMPAYVRGNVYCGGNSSTVVYDESRDDVGDIRFEIGDHVTLNGVYLGSNGEDLVNSDMMYYTELINGIDLLNPNTLTEEQVAEITAGVGDTRFEGLDNLDLYPHLLDLYMHAVDVNALPSGFNLSDDLEDAYIGDFFVGGNSGSMMTPDCISLTLPESLVIYGKVVGGSNNATLYYKGMPHVGGLTRPLRNNQTTKVDLSIKSKFEPWRLEYPQDGDLRKIRLVADGIKVDGKTYFSPRRCMVYGGSYNSGSTVGNIHIDMYSDMVADYDPDSKIAKALALNGIGTGAGLSSKKRTIVNGIDRTDGVWRSFGLVGGGFGELSEVHGDIRLRLLPGKAHPGYRAGISDESPSVATLFGGSVKGLIVGNTTIELRDGSVLTNIFGASEAAEMFGSTQIIVGWPEYYVCKTRGNFFLNRTDDISKAAKDREAWFNHDGTGTYSICRYASYREGDIISRQVYDLLPDAASRACFEPAVDTQPHDFKVWNDDHTSFTKPLTYDDIDIQVGDPKSLTDPNAEYLRHGNIYGGGFISADANVSLAGSPTVKRFDKNHNNSAADYNLSEPRLSYGGNSTIIIWDNPENADLTRAISAPGATPGTGAGTAGALIRDHVTIGTGKYERVYPKAGQDIIGKFVLDKNPASSTYGRYVHQSSHRLTADDPMLDLEFYEMVCDGGIYGAGRKVYVEGFRTCDLSYYGYADYSPQFPKLLNTAQRLDLFSITDCCLMLQGANDFATNSVDATPYSLNRVSELMMNSSIADADVVPADAVDLDPGYRADATGLYNILHNNRRIRNYIALFNNVHYLAAVTSNVDFDAPYRGASGRKYVTGDYLIDPSNGSDDANNPQIGDPSQFSYREYKKRRIDYFYEHRDDTANPGSEPSEPDLTSLRAKLAFDQRNVGTAANMIGINNGYTLKVQGYAVQPDGTDKVYYGPVNGVFEVKLLTLAQDEGGGYIFAFNHHDDPNNFLETTGNFLFPGAAYLVSSDTNEHYNYIYDDCFPMGRGFDYYYGTAAASPAPGRLDPKATAVAPGHGDCNEEQEVHYWYVNGTHFFFNVTLTAFTYNEHTEFFLDNNDQLVYLYGVNPTRKYTDGRPDEPGSTLSVRSVIWDPSQNVEPDLLYTSAGTPADNRAAALPYKFFLSVDDESGEPHTLETANTYSFVTPIPRADFDLENGTIDTAASPAADAGHVVNNYSELVDENGHIVKSNVPLIGITFVDNMTQYGTNTRTYYENHLKEDEKVSIDLRADGGPTTFTYTIHLTVKYLLGPTITGRPTIENCALPGEYIFVNSFGVDVDFDDDNMAVNERNWYLFPPTYDITDAHHIERVIEEKISTDPAVHVDHPILLLNTEKFNNTDRQVHIPAYRWLNDWNVVYEIVTNGRKFYRTKLSNLAENEEEDDDLKEFRDHMVVHNYHRMRPWNGTSTDFDEHGDEYPHLEELNITDQARIYIEDDDDMLYFYEWLYDRQSAPTRTTIAGEVIDPQYAEGLLIFLMDDVHMPNPDEIARYNVPSLRFRGTFHGNGHTIVMGENMCFLGINEGSVYNTGFVSEQPSADARVFTTNTGNVESCFFYNPKNISRGTLIAQIDTDPVTGVDGTVVNCFQTSPQPSGVTGLRQASLDEFNYGEVAYNLNRFYLKKRYNLGTNTPDGDLVAPINRIYHEGEYRYAKWSDDGNPEALRTFAVPNYLDYMGKRLSMPLESYGAITGYTATHHNCSDPYDPERVDRVNASDPTSEPKLDENGHMTYTPVFPDDYIFFGQDLSMTASFAGSAVHSYPGVPTTVNDDNRVYRSSGFYGRKHDYGFHFNADATALQRTLSAIDFIGVRDRQHGNRYGIEYEMTYPDQTAYYPPMLDLPQQLLWFDVGGDVSHNLLIYTPECGDDDEENITQFEVLGEYVYTRDTREEDIACHIIPAAVDSEGAINLDGTPRTRIFHLVDLHNFDAPIAFEVSDTTMYQRVPSVYSSGGDGWEGLCLPFTVRDVYGKTDNPRANPIRDRGQLTHFYGPSISPDEEAPSHEYWLRKFTDYTDGKLYFTRPSSEFDVAAGNPADKTNPKYHYENDYFSRIYGTGYTELTSHARPTYKPGGVDYIDYPMITEQLPYIIAYPGRKFYEFDLSDTFYLEHFPGGVESAQRITYMTPGLVTIPVTEGAGDPKAITHNGYELRGTFHAHTPTACDALIHDDGDDNNGSFRRARSSAQTVPPFRVYLHMPSSSPAPMPIASRALDIVTQPEPDDEPESLDEGMMADLEVYVENHRLLIVSPFEYDVEVPLYDVAGRLLRILTVRHGDNYYDDINRGTYLVASAKVIL